MIDRTDLMQYLQKIDNELKEKITLIAVGGTAMTLLGLKDSTKDVDFCTESKKEQGVIKAASEKVDNQTRIDLFSEGYIFSVQLPDDYVTRAKTVKESFKNLKLKILHPIDIIVSKTDRLNERDIEDIEALIKKKRITKTKLQQRYGQVIGSIPGKEENFKYHTKYVLKMVGK
ncbi:hypothetical protein HYU12_05405 [Candidatus Woesearchaeota archaeon]|nr:hypothetical protein [Candidatus Woesearchaeota archaeon]